MTLVSRNIRYLRQLHGYTQERLAQAIGIKRSLLAAYEDGRAAPSLPNLIRFARLFGLTIDELVTIDMAVVKKAASVVSDKNPISLFEENDIEEDHNDPEETTPEDEDETSADTLPYRSTAHSKNSAPKLFQSKHHDTDAQEEQASSTASLYPTIDDIFRQSVSTSTDISFVPTKLLPDYYASFEENSFIQSLPRIQISLLDRGKRYRAFEATPEMGFQQAILVGEYVRNWYRISDLTPCLLLTQRYGLVYAQIKNHLRDKQAFYLADGHYQGTSLQLKEIFEIWQVVLFIGRKVPPADAHTHALLELIEQLQQQLEHLLRRR